jgi:carbamoyl-phosphate synthase small subunit
VDPESVRSECDITHVNLNDQTVEGMTHRKYPLFAIQYHPEASPGPHDSRYLFKRFRELIEKS